MASSLTSLISDSESLSSRKKRSVPKLDGWRTGVENGLRDERGHYFGNGCIIFPAAVENVFDNFCQLVHFDLLHK